MTLFEVHVTFHHARSFRIEPLHEALLHLKGFDFEAPTKELAEHWATLVHNALLDAANRS